MSHRPRNRFTLGSLLVVVASIGVVVGLARAFGPHGLGLGLYLCAATWYAISFTTWSSFRPLNSRPWTKAEALAVFVACGWAHLLALPPRQYPPYIPPEWKLVHEAIATLPELPHIDVPSPDRFLNDLMLSPYWTVQKDQRGCFVARARSVGVDWPDDGENSFLFAFMAKPNRDLPKDSMIFNHGVRGDDALNGLDICVVFQKPERRGLTFGESEKGVTIPVYEFHQEAISRNSTSYLAIRLSTQHDIYMILDETGADPARAATFETLVPAMQELAGLADSPDEYRVDERYAEFFNVFFDSPFADSEIRRFPGMQGQDTFYGYFRTQPDTSYAGVNIKISHPVYCPDEGTSKTDRLRRAEYLGKPYMDSDLLFFLIDHNGVYLSSMLYDWRFGYFTGNGNTFEGNIDVLNDEEKVLLRSKGRFTSWQR
jgi:hypothetical protein